jgi:sulfite reductase (ferredoxin)
MSTASKSWKDHLADQIVPQIADEVDAFEAQMLLRKAGKIEDRVFAETRLRRGAYGQRYDNGRRHDGTKTQELAFPQSPLTKGPETMWDAPGMQRIKIPFGGLNPRQMNVLAELAEEYSDNICHITTRQDFQLHYVHIEDTPNIMRRLGAVGITTREACGNSVRNVTACPLAGVCRTESFDVTPYAKAVAYYLLGHPDTQDFGRKFKIAFSGCEHEACALVSIHDLGGIAATRIGPDGKLQRGFKLFVGGGLGAVPHQAKLLMEFCPEEEVMPVARAIGRVFARLGEKKNRQKARLKFVVHKLGIEEFKKIVQEERRAMPEDPSWRKHFDQINDYRDEPVMPPTSLNGGPKPEGYAEWAKTNVYPQRQKGYAVVTITCPLGDLTSDQMRALAKLADRYAGGNVRTTVEQNLVFRWVSEADVPSLYSHLAKLGLNEPGAGTIVDLVACPGTDTCKLGIASSRGLAGELRERLYAKSMDLDESIRGLRIKVSGCFNSCGQHHVADLGFYGNSRNIGGYTVPHFQVIIGGKWLENGGSYGLAIGSIPSKAIPQVVERLTDRYVKEKQADDTFQLWCQRVGKKQLKAMIDDLAHVPPHAENPDFYTDWGDPRAYTIGDMGTGECAGEMVSQAEFGFRDAESSAFEAQLLLEEGKYQEADQKAYEAMITAAKTLVRIQHPDVPADPGTIVNEFRNRFVETKLFWDRFHHGQFANYLFNRHEHPDTRYTEGTAHQVAEEAQLFIDAAHKCHAKILEQTQNLVQIKL